MKAVIQNIEYEVRFRHTRLPGHDKRIMPTLADAVAILSLADLELSAPGELEKQHDIKVGAMIREFQDAYIGACITKSHSTDCYILDADRRKPFDQRLVSSGQTFCDKMDNFNRAEGRWYAFGKAIDAFPVSAQAEWLEWFMDAPMRKPFVPRAIAQCARPPAGWFCSRGAHHKGPCAARPTMTVTEVEMPADVRKGIADNLAFGKALGHLRAEVGSGI